MSKIGQKIRDVRKKKGLTQEELAETAKVNLRTIQRIENDENEPRGKTLNLICQELELNAEDILDYGKQIDTNYLIFLHLSVLLGIIIPAGNIILPTILWFNKKDKIIGVNEIGANLINFQIIWTLVLFITVTIGVLLKISHTSIGPITGGFMLTYPWLILYFINIILPITFATKLRNGKIKNLYPNLIKLLK